MKPLDQYTNNTASPTKAKFRVYNVYKRGKVIVSEATHDMLITSFPELNSTSIVPDLKKHDFLVEVIDDSTQYASALDAYRTKNKELQDMLRDDLFDDHGLTSTRQSLKAFSMAVDSGGSVSSIIDEFGELAELLT